MPTGGELETEGVERNTVLLDEDKVPAGAAVADECSDDVDAVDGDALLFRRTKRALPDL